MRCLNTDKNLHCDVVNTLFEREVPYYCHKITPNVITPCASQGKVYLLNNDLTASVIRELNGKNYPACFNNLNGSESRKKIGCQKVRAPLCPVSDNLLSPYLTNLLCQLTAMNKNKNCLWAAPMLPKKLWCMELAVLVGLLNALKYNTDSRAFPLANGLKAKLVEEILSQYNDTSCGRTPDCSKVQIADQIMDEVEQVLEKMNQKWSCPAGVSGGAATASNCGRDQTQSSWSQQVECMASQLNDLAEVNLRGSPLLCQVRDLVHCCRSLNWPSLCASRKRQLASGIMCQLNRLVAQINDNPPRPGCGARTAHILGALNRLRDAVAQAVCQLNCKSNLITSCEQSATAVSTPRGCKYNVTTPDSCSDIVAPSPRCPPPPSCTCCSVGRCTCPAQCTCAPTPSCSYDVPIGSRRCEVVTPRSNSRPESVCASRSRSRCRSRSRSRGGSEKSAGHSREKQLSTVVQDRRRWFGANQEPKCSALDSAISQLKELKLCINGPQVVGYVKSPKTLCDAIFSDLKNSPYLRAHLFRPRKSKRKPKFHYMEIKSCDPCNPQSFFLEFVL